MNARLFVPQALIDEWIVAEKVDVQGAQLTILPFARRYEMQEAVRVQGELTGAGDAHGLSGKVKALPALVALGADVVEGSMLLGDLAYDAVTGWLLRPQGEFDEFVLSTEYRAARSASGAPEVRSEDEVLAFLSG